MRLVRAIDAELRKLFTLPATWAGIAVTVLGTVAITVLNVMSARSEVLAGEVSGIVEPVELAFAAAPLGTVGALVIGVIAISSEYAANSTDAGGGRQIGTTLTAMPGRLRVLGAKIVAALVVMGFSALVALSACLGVSLLAMRGAAPVTTSVDQTLAWAGGAALYWVLSGLIGLAITVMTRSGVVPLIVLIMNSSLVSFSLLLTNLTPLAYWLPDMAGRRLFGAIDTVDGGLGAGPGAIVMAAWTVLLLATAGAVFSRREA